MTEEFSFAGLTVVRMVLGSFQVNTYLVVENEGRSAFLIDPALPDPDIIKKIKEYKVEKTTIFLTHGHADHILGVDFCRRECGAEVWCSAEDARMVVDPGLNLSALLGENFVIQKPDKTIVHEQKVCLGKHAAQVIALPGHTPGGLALCFDSLVFSGDALFAGSIGRSDFPGGDGHLLVRMIRERLLTLSDRTVFPGHGPETTIAAEKAENPFFSDD